jgi:hypothetical protein
MRGEDLVVVFRRQIARRVERQRLLRPHHDGVGEAAQQHHHRQEHIHNTDPLVIDAGDPLLPQIGQVALQHDPKQDT